MEEDDQGGAQLRATAPITATMMTMRRRKGKKTKGKFAGEKRPAHRSEG